jgi:hypothetical protein
MSDIKYVLPKFEGKPESDSQLCSIRLEAILEDKGLDVYVDRDDCVPSPGKN